MRAGERRDSGAAPLTRVVAATDFSAGAAVALQRLALLPLARGASITLLHVLPSRAPAPAKEVAEARLQTLCAALRQSLPAVARSDATISPKCVTGRTCAEIARFARERDAELILLGRHGQGGLKDLFLGSTAERVVRLAEAPTLIVGRAARHAYERPLVAVGLDDGSDAVAECATRLLGPGARPVRLLHACTPPFEGFVVAGEPPQARAAYDRACRETATAGLSALSAFLESRLGRPFRRSVHLGDPRGVIASEARRRRADLIALGTHRRSGIAHALLGSVAEQVLRAAECDVLVTRTPGTVLHGVS